MEAPREASLLAAERIRASIAGQGLSVGKGAVPITVSIGVCTSEDQHDIEPDSVRACADAPRHAKSRGKDRVCGQPQRPATIRK